MGSYMIEQGICFLTLAEKGYPKRLAFLYLEEIHQAFVGELRNDYGEEWRHKASSSCLFYFVMLLIALCFVYYLPFGNVQRYRRVRKTAETMY